MDNSAGPNYFDILSMRYEKLGSAEFPVVKLKFGKYSLLKRLQKMFVDTENRQEKLNLIFRMFDLLEISADLHEPALLPLLLNENTRVNQVAMLFAWQKETKAPERMEIVEDIGYEGREIAFVTGILADAFGWSVDVVLELLPEEVAAYVQEALLALHRREEFFYNLSDAGVEKQGSDFRKVPYPKLPWIESKIEINRSVKGEKVDPRFEPDGVIVDLTKL